METAPAKTLIEEPRHPYSQALVSAVPIPDPEAEAERITTALEGELPSPISPPSGCVFRTRCPRAKASCAEERPPMLEPADQHHVACPFHD